MGRPKKVEAILEIEKNVSESKKPNTKDKKEIIINMPRPEVVTREDAWRSYECYLLELILKNL